MTIESDLYNKIIHIDDKEISWILAILEEKIYKYTKQNEINAANNLRKLSNKITLQRKNVVEV